MLAGTDPEGVMFGRDAHVGRRRRDGLRRRVPKRTRRAHRDERRLTVRADNFETGTFGHGSLARMNITPGPAVRVLRITCPPSESESIEVLPSIAVNCEAPPVHPSKMPT